MAMISSDILYMALDAWGLCLLHLQMLFVNTIWAYVLLFVSEICLLLRILVGYLDQRNSLVN